MNDVHWIGKRIIINYVNVKINNHKLCKSKTKCENQKLKKSLQIDTSDKMKFLYLLATISTLICCEYNNDCHIRWEL